MIIRFTAILLIGLFLVAGCSGEKKESATEQAATGEITTAKEAYAEARKKRGETESIEERLAITKDFLKAYPESDQTANALRAVFYYQSYRLEDNEGAIAYAEGIRSQIENTAIGIEVDKVLLGFYAESGLSDKMTGLAEKLAETDNLDFSDHWNVIEGAVKLEDWQLVRTYCAGAKTKTTAEAYRADNPDEELTEEKIETAVKNRQGMVLVKDGWAQANLGQIDQALAVFAQADKLIPRFYFDIPEYDLDIYWGKTLLEKKEYQAAIDMVDMSALIMGHDKAKDILKKSYAGLHGDSGFEAFAADLNIKIAPAAPDFEMPDYDGTRHSFNDLRDDVTMVALWFPT
jgi:hypothetical protein